MSQSQIASHVARFLSAGGAITQCPTRYAYGAGAEGRRYFHPMLGRWILTA